MQGDKTQAILEVQQAGALASLQDIGRRHNAQHGVTEGGVADLHAALWANYLLGRASNAPLIEISVGLFAVEFKCDCQIVITGADLNASINQQPISPWQTFAVNRGDLLQFASPASGMLSYLAINARLNIDRVFGSVSTVMREQLGGLAGRALTVGDRLSGNPAQTDYVHHQVPQQYIPDYNEPLELQLIPGYQFEQFPKLAIDAFFNSQLQIQSSSNRMAYTLRGAEIEHDIKTLPSEGIAYGAVQIPPDGNPVILLNDRQTIGGYPKLGCITRLSGAALVQRHFPDKVNFKLCSIEDAAAEYQSHLRFFQK